MTKVAVEYRFTGNTTKVSAYDSTKTNLGVLISQFTGANPQDKWAGPLPTVIARPMEASTAVPGQFPCAVDNGSGKQYLFLADAAATAATRRIVCYEQDMVLGTLAWKGYITVTFPSATTYIIKGFRVKRYPYSTGTVQVAGTAVTGTSTGWKTYGCAAGSRIGFGSTDPTQITTWYQIAPGSALASDTAITLSTTAGTIAAGTPYIIEDYRAVIAATNITTTNGGLFIVKGLNPEMFIPAGGAVAAATTIDNIRACYWLADAATVLNVTAAGVCTDGTIAGDGLTHMAYVLDSTGPKVFKYNMRKALTLTAGKDTTAWVLTSGVQVPTGTFQTANNGRIATLKHGPGNNAESLYFVTTTRIYRCLLTGITSASVNWMTDSMTEVPPGGVAAFVATGAMATLEVADSIDRLIVMTTGAAGTRSYVTQYRVDSGQMDHVFCYDNKQLEASTTDANLPAVATTMSQAQSAWAEDGMFYMCGIGITAALNIIHAFPLGAHWTYATTNGENNRLITPAIALPGATKLYRGFTNEVDSVGGGEQLISPGSYRVLARTSGITDNLGGWTTLDASGDISGLACTGTIQFAYEFRMIDEHCVGSRILGGAVLYESGDSIPSHMQWNFDDSDKTTGIVGFLQKALYGSTPALSINYYRNDTDGLLLTQTSASTTNGVFEYWSGSAWTAGVGADTVGLRRRFRPTAGLPASVSIYPKLSVV